MRPSVRVSQLQSLRETLFQACGVTELICNGPENSPAESRILGIVDVINAALEFILIVRDWHQHGIVDITAVFQLSSLAADVRGVRQPIPRELIPHLEIVLIR